MSGAVTAVSTKFIPSITKPKNLKNKVSSWFNLFMFGVLGMKI